MPAGTTPTEMPVPASSAQTVRTVPSPPHTITSSAPATAACSAIERPGSSTVVVNQVGSFQPAAAAARSTITLNASTSSTLIGFSTTASLRVVGPGVLNASRFLAFGAGS